MKKFLRPIAAWALVLALGTALSQHTLCADRSWRDMFRRSAEPETTATVPVTPPVLDLQESFARVASAVKPAVVSVTSVHVESVEEQPFQFFFGDPFEEFFFGPGRSPRPQAPPRRFERRTQGMGSGVIVDAEGYVLTNEHVVRGATDIQVRVMNPAETVYKGKVVGSDPRTDIAIVKIKPKGKLTAAPLGDSDKLRVGDWAVAVGSPFGLEQTVTAGIISAVRQSLQIEGHVYANLIQTDAAINQGNSGGPLLNIRGEVIGINTAIYAPTGVFAGVGFAIPSNRAKEIMEQLIEKGRVVRGWIGVEIMPLNDVLARQFSVPDGKGVVVNRVLPGSPAEKAGLLRGDVIREFDGKSIDALENLQQVVGKTPPKSEVKVSVVRKGERKEVTLKTEEMPAETAQAPGDPAEEGVPGGSFEWEGAEFVDPSDELRRRQGLPEGVRGPMAAGVQPGSTAEEMGLVPGDIIGSVNGKDTPDLAAFKKAVKDADIKKGVVLDVNRRGRWLYLSFQRAE